METRDIYNILAEEQRLQHCAESPGFARPNIEGVCFNGDRVFATDGHVLAYRAKDKSRDIENTTLRFANPDLSKAKGAKFVPTQETYTKFGAKHLGATNPKNVLEHVETDCQYPDIDAMLGSIPESMVSLSIDVDLLVRVAKAIGNDKVTLSFNPEYPLSAIKVRAYDHVDGMTKAIVMPLRDK